MAGFQVSMYGRFWVSTEDCENHRSTGRSRCTYPVLKRETPATKAAEQGVPADGRLRRPPRNAWPSVIPTMIDAVLFDLDETLIDRTASVSRYAALFHRAFAGHLRGASVADVESTLVSLDERGYRPRDEVYAGIAKRLRWHSEPDISVVRDHWLASFPASAVGRSGR